MKKLIVFLLIAAIAVSSVFSQGKNESSGGSDNVTLTLYGPAKLFLTEQDTIDPVTGTVNMGYAAIVERWNELHPNVTLDIQGIGWNDWRAAVATAVSSGDVDIILHGGMLTSLVEDLGPYVEQDPEIWDMLYSKSVYHSTEFEGKTLRDDVIDCIQYAVNPTVMVLDTKIFEDYGIPLPDPDTYTWGDVISLAEQMTGIDPVTGEQTYGYKIKGTHNTDPYKHYLMIASAYDAKTITFGDTLQDSVYDFTGEKTIKVFDTIVELAKYCSPDNVEGIDGVENFTAENNAAMFYCEDTGQAYGQLIASGLEDRFKFINLPIIEEGEYKGLPSAHLGDNNIAICRYSPDKDWAWEFIKFLMTDDVCAKVMASKGLRGNTETMIDLLTESIGEENVATLKYVLDRIPEGYNNSINDFYDTVNIGSMEAFMASNIAELIKGSITSEQCAANIQQEVDNSIAMSI